ncbi:hypothetical protein ACLOJK_014015 [Asimina triloba]
MALGVEAGPNTASASSPSGRGCHVEAANEAFKSCGHYGRGLVRLRGGIDSEGGQRGGEGRLTAKKRVMELEDEFHRAVKEKGEEGPFRSGALTPILANVRDAMLEEYLSDATREALSHSFYTRDKYRKALEELSLMYLRLELWRGEGSSRKDRCWRSNMDDGH